MTYQVVATTLADPRAAVSAVLDQNGVDADIADDLTAAGATVLLANGRSVWCSCIVHDRPETPSIDFIVVAFEVADGALRVKPNGQNVSVCTWRAVLPELLDAWTVPVIRKACLMIALGEPQPQVPIPVPAEGGPTAQDVFVLPDADKANGCILPMMSAADQLAAPLSNVL